MNIAIIGTGNVGKGLATVLSTTRHGVVFGARTSEAGHAAAEAFVQAHGRAVQGGSVAEAVKVADVVMLAVPFGAIDEVIAAAGDLTGKTIVDVTNPLTEDFSGLTIGHDTSAAEQIQAKAGKAAVVKAFNTVFAQVYGEGPAFGDTPVQVFYAGDDEAAKQTVARIIDDAGFAAVDAGGLNNARFLEPLAALNIQFGYGLGRGTQIAPAWMERGAA